MSHSEAINKRLSSHRQHACVLAMIVATHCFGCATPMSEAGTTNGSGGTPEEAGTAADAGGTEDAPRPDGTTPADGGALPAMDGGGTPGQEPGEVFGHSAGSLYKLEPYSKEVTIVGKFQGCNNVIDLALDKDSQIVATSADGLYWIDKTTAACTEIALGDYPNSLSFVPTGILDPNDEVLVGYRNDTYVRIDTTSGVMTDIGSIGGGYLSSGDIVSVEGGGTYLTIKGNGCGDCLFEVDPKTGEMVKDFGPINYGAVYGIAFWAGSVYGFTSAGRLFEVTFENGEIVTSDEIAIPDAPSGLSFWGAGSTTIAPLTPPPK